MALPPSSARPKTIIFLKPFGFFGLVTPGLQETTWPKNHFGIPLNCRREEQEARARKRFEKEGTDARKWVKEDLADTRPRWFAGDAVGGPGGRQPRGKVLLNLFYVTQ